ncbi:MAG: HEAT repeat domain-containing protein [Planctomycetota bacterium]|jgi:HEAT repeat protein/tellurite resistance protein
MKRSRYLLSLLLLTAFALAQDEDACGCGEGCDDGCGDEESTFTFGDGVEEEDGSIDIKIDPAEQPPPPDADPNRPPPIRVGEWQPPTLDAEARKQLAGLKQAKADRPKDIDVRYDLARFYAKHGWHPKAEAEYLGCAQLAPDSIRPWEKLLQLYVQNSSGEGDDGVNWVQLPGGRIRLTTGLNNPNRRDWITEAQRVKRISRAHREILKRRPDDLARRRLYIAHLVAAGDQERIIEQARIILARLPDDAELRYAMSEAVRRLEAQRAKAEERDPDYTEAKRILEENLKRAPHHARSCLRLSRLVAVSEGAKAEERIRDLQQRGLFYLLVPRDLAPVTYREDAFQLARDLAGRPLCNWLWDNAMIGQARPGDRYRRWVYMQFPRRMHSERLETVRRLARRSDTAAVGALIGFLWNLWDKQGYMQNWEGPLLNLAQQQEELETASIEAASGMGAVFYQASERFLRRADTPVRRTRAVQLMRVLRDKRAVEPLVEALAWDVDKTVSYQVAACLEQLGDPRAIDALVDAATDLRRPSPRRREAAEALAAFKDPRSVETLSRLHKEPEFRLETTYGLFRLTGEAPYAKAIEEMLTGTATGQRMLTLLNRCETEKVEDLALHAFRASDQLRPQAMAILRARFWKTAEPKVRKFLLDESQEAGVGMNTLQYLGEIGGDEVTDRLLNIVQTLSGDQWARGARALAETGHKKAEQYFRKRSILEKDSKKRRLAAQLIDVTARRRIERQKAAARG